LIQAQLFFSEFFWGIFDRKPAAEKPWSAGRDRTYQQAHFETLKAETLRY